MKIDPTQYKMQLIVADTMRKLLTEWTTPRHPVRVSELAEACERLQEALDLPTAREHPLAASLERFLDILDDELELAEACERRGVGRD